MNMPTTEDDDEDDDEDTHEVVDVRGPKGRANEVTATLVALAVRLQCKP
jgi:hypothetical protein